MTRLLTYIICLTTSVNALADAKFVLIGEDLKHNRVTLNTLRDDDLSYFDAERRLVNASITKFLQIRSSSVRLKSIARNAVVIDTVNAQRFVGDWVGTDDEGQILKITHDVLGELAIDLEQVARVQFSAATNVSARTPSSDEVHLANGDTLTGFIVAVTNENIELQVKGQPKPVSFPRERVRSINLANPVLRSVADGHLVHLNDHVRLLAKKMNANGDELTIETPVSKKPVVLELANVQRIDLASRIGRLVDLSELTMQVTSGGKVFGLPMPPRIENASVWLHAPVKVAWKLPTGAARFAASGVIAAEPSTGASESTLAWSNFIVNVGVENKVVASHHIHAQRPKIDLNVAISGKTMTIDLDPGRNGPVMDRLRLVDAVIFVKSK